MILINRSCVYPGERQKHGRASESEEGRDFLDRQEMEAAAVTFFFVSY